MSQTQTQSTQTQQPQKPQYKLIVQRHTEYKNVKAIGTGAGIKPNEDATISSVRLCRRCRWCKSA